MLTHLDAYILRRYFVGYSIDNLTPSPLIASLISANRGEAGLVRLQQVLGHELTQQIFAIDPASPPPVAAAQQALSTYVPPLPDYAQVVDNHAVGGWLDEAMNWAIKRSPMTPAHMLEAGLIWALSLAVARRVCLQLAHAQVFTNMYVLWVAHTSIYRKSTGLTLIEDLIERTIPHMRLPEDNTPEGLVAQLAGQKPANYDNLTTHEKKLHDAGAEFAAQRGILVDEASSLFGQKEYMKGNSELFMRLFDARPVFRRNMKGSGIMTVKYSGMGILGATTPAALGGVLNRDAYDNGLFARFLSLAPAGNAQYIETEDADFKDAPDGLAGRYMKLYTALPAPPTIEKMMSEDNPKWNMLTAGIDQSAYKAFGHYSKALSFDLIQPGAGIDERLIGNYARLPTYALKIALILAAIDWSDGGGAGLPHVSANHYGRAQNITERYRESLHRTIDLISMNEDTQAENSVKNLLRQHPQGLTITEINNKGGSRKRDVIKSALESMVEAGEVEKLVTQSQHNRPVTLYRLNV